MIANSYTETLASEQPAGQELLGQSLLITALTHVEVFWQFNCNNSLKEQIKMDNFDVIIIGAGLTGLSLAKSLSNQGKNFTVLEARDRIGGRIHTVETEGGAVIEMGATWFFPTFKNLFKLLKEMKVELTEQYLKGYTMYESDKDSPPRKSYSSGEDDDMFRIKGGTSKIVETLYNSVDKGTVRLGEKVTEIRADTDGVKVVSNGQTFRCKRVVTTIPPQLLAYSVKFSPPLQEDMLTVLKETHTWMGDSVKGAVTYASPFWKEDGLSGGLYSNCGPFVQMYDQTTSDGKHAALVGFVHDGIAHLTLEERRDSIIAQLVRVFGEPAKDYLEYKDTIWFKEKFSMAGPANGRAPKVGRHKNNGHRMFQQPLMEGRLIIGGSETSPQAGGYMEGAVNSAKHVDTLLKRAI